MKSKRDTTIMRAHDHAMAMADEGDRAIKAGDTAASTAYYRAALLLETLAADGAAAKPQPYEPTRAILYRSAATCALMANDRTEAARLARCGLTDTTPADLADELREVLFNATR